MRGGHSNPMRSGMNPSMSHAMRGGMHSPMMAGGMGAYGGMNMGMQRGCNCGGMQMGGMLSQVDGDCSKDCVVREYTV